VFQAGTYGAIVTIPADMSARVVSINAQSPIQVELLYEINDNLSRDNYIEVYQRISHAQNSLRTALSYVFITSILEDVHLGQAQIARVSERDQADLDAVFVLRHTNFMTGLALADMPSIDSDFHVFDDTELIEQAADTFALDVSELYYRRHQEMLTVFDSAGIEIDSAQGELMIWQENHEDYFTALMGSTLEYSEYLREWHEELEDVIAKLEGYMGLVIDFQNALSDYRDELNDYREDELEPYRIALSGYRADLDAYRSALDDYRLYLGGGGLGSFNPMYIPGPFPGVEPGPLPDKFEDTLSVEGTFVVGIFPELPIGALAVRDNMENSLAGSLGIVALEGYIAHLNAIIASYDPQRFFVQALQLEADRSRFSLGSSISALRTSLDASQLENMGRLGLSHAEMLEYAMQLGADVRDQHDVDAENLDNALGLLFEQRQTTSDENMGSFAVMSNLLPNTHTGGAVNQQVAHFIVDPLGAEQVSTLSTGAQTSVSLENIQLSMLVILAVLIAATLLTFVLRLFARAKKAEAY